MSDKTGISYCNATWSPARGCDPVSPGCAHCWAAGMASRFSDPGMWGHGFATGGKWTGKVELIPSQLDKPLRWRKPRVILTQVEGDLFHPALPFEQIAAVYGVMAACPQHTFLVLTKRPERRLEWHDWLGLADITLGGRPFEKCCVAAGRMLQRPVMTYGQARWPLPNVWEGTSVEGLEHLHRLDELAATPAAHLWASFEPLLADLGDLLKWLPHEVETGQLTSVWAPGIDAVVVGGESGPRARPCDIAWVRSILGQCQAAGVPCHVKQLGAHVHEYMDGALTRISLDNRSGGDPSEWPEDLRAAHGPGSLAW